MEKVAWKEEFSLGNVILDEQNRYFLQSIQELGSVDITLADYILESVLFYAHSHFEAEEELLQENNFEDYDIHVAMHQNFLGQLGEIQGRIYLQNITPKEIQGMLLHWFHTHICIEDMLCKRYVLHHV